VQRLRQFFFSSPWPLKMALAGPAIEVQAVDDLDIVVGTAFVQFSFENNQLNVQRVRVRLNPPPPPPAQEGRGPGERRDGGEGQAAHEARDLAPAGPEAEEEEDRQQRRRQNDGIGGEAAAAPDPREPADDRADEDRQPHHHRQRHHDGRNREGVPPLERNPQGGEDLHAIGRRQEGQGRVEDGRDQNDDESSGDDDAEEVLGRIRAQGARRQREYRQRLREQDAIYYCPFSYCRRQLATLAGVHYHLGRTHRLSPGRIAAKMADYEPAERPRGQRRPASPRRD